MTGDQPAHSNSPSIRTVSLGIKDYLPVYRCMQGIAETRDAAACDELWLLQHPPVFTLGLNGKREHLLAPGDIPVIETDRGGQVTYHGPGQLIVYLLMNLERRGLGVRALVQSLEAGVISLLRSFDIEAQARRDAPGVYVQGAKIASIGLRVKRGMTYHGLSLNVDMDLEPFARINPCGMKDLKVTQLADLVAGMCCESVAPLLLDHVARALGYERAIESQQSLLTPQLTPE